MLIISRTGGTLAVAALAVLAACSDPMVRDDGEDGPGQNELPWQQLQGTLLVTSVSGTGGVDLQLVDATQRTVRTIATGVTAPAGPTGAVFSLAPDLQSVAYAEVLSQGMSDLRSIPIGSDPVDCSATCGEPLVVTEDWEWGPAWSRDGRLAYNAVRSEGSGIVVDGEPAHGDTLFSRDFVRPAWAPDGSLAAPLTLLTRQGGGSPSLYRLDPTTRGATLLIPDVWERQLQGWAISPTDGRLAYFSDRSGGVWIADPDGQNAVEVAAGYGPVWSPDGSQIAFASPALDEGTGERLPALYVVDVSGGTPLMVLPNATVRDWR